jgi:gliding motility-associated-like protein
LPDNTIVKDSGTYYVVNKTLAGCDSITFTNIKIDKSLSSLSLGNDSCLTGNSTIELKATEGYTAYSWMNGPSVSSNKFTVNRAGIYKVSVTNICGTKADSIEIYDRCDFPVFLPDAFTPNRDNLNDYFGVPLQNKNRLISLTVYNRWGQVVFETNSVYKRWDGTFKNQVLKTDIFVYYLVMQGLSGNKITQKGKLMLIR